MTPDALENTGSWFGGTPKTTVCFPCVAIIKQTLGLPAGGSRTRRKWFSLRAQLYSIAQQDPRTADATSVVMQMADEATNIAAHFDGNMGQVAKFLGGELMASHRNPELIENHFSAKGFADMGRLMETVRHGVPVDVEDGGDLLEALRYGNHPSMHTHSDLVWRRLVEDLAWGRVVVLHKSMARGIKHIRVSPLAVAESKDKKRVILDLSYGKGGPQRGRTGVNGDTNFDGAPLCEVGGVLTNVLRRICALRDAVGTKVPVYTAKMDVKDAFRRIHVEWEKAPVFAYTVGNLLVIDFRMPFGWRNSPGWWSLTASAVAHSHRNTNLYNAVVLPDACAIAEGVSVVPPPKDSAAAGAPEGVTVEPFAGDPINGNFDSEMYVDDMISTEACPRGNEARLIVATKSAVSDHLRMLGSSQANPVPVMSQKKLTDWLVAQEILGFVVDTQKMSISVPARKIDEIQTLLKEWPSTRQEAKAKQVWSLTGKLRHIATVLRPGRYMVWRLEFCTGVANLDHVQSVVQKETTVRLNEEFHADLGWWKWAVQQASLLAGVSLYSPFYDHVHWPPTRHWLSDATLKAIGGLCLESRTWWRYDLSHEEQSRADIVAACAKHNKLSINLLELLAMVVTAYVMVAVKGDRPAVHGEPVLMRGDSMSAVTWVNRCGGTRNPRAAFIMRWLGVLEMEAGWCLESAHIAGATNVLADGITRWNRADIPQKLSLLFPSPLRPWQEASLGEGGGRACSEILRPFSHESELRRRLTTLIPQLGNCGVSGGGR